MKAGHGSKKSTNPGIFVDDPIDTTLHVLAKINDKKTNSDQGDEVYRDQRYERHLFLPSGGKGDMVYSLPPHESQKKYSIIRYEIFHKIDRTNRVVFIQLFFGERLSNQLRILPNIDYPFRDCDFEEGDENCKKIQEIAAKRCPGCDAVKYRLNLWQLPSNNDSRPWLCKRIDPLTGKISESDAIRLCKFCHTEISSTDPRVFFCCPEHRYEYQKYRQRNSRQSNQQGTFLSLVKTWNSSPKRCKQCGGVLTGRQRDWCGDRCRKIFEREERIR